MKLNVNTRYQLFIFLLALIFFVPFLGGVHLFDWDEINFAESAREMILSKDFLTVQINYQPFWEKPPLFIWMQVLSMKIFGINEFAARFPNAICGIFTLLVLFNIGKKIYSQQFGFLWVIVYLGSILPHFYFKSGLIDPWFNLFIFCGLYFMIEYWQQWEKDKIPPFSKRLICASLSGLFIGLGVLTKGPVALLLFALTVIIYLSIQFFRKQWKLSQISAHLLPLSTWIIIFSLTGGFWFILQIFNGNYKIIVDFIQYQKELFSAKVAGHGGFFGYHFVVLFFGVFPASIFALKAFRKNNFDDKLQKNFKFWMLVLFWVVLILFSIVKTKIVHYSSLAYFPITFLASWSIWYMAQNKLKWNKAINAALFSILGLIAVILIALQYVGMNASEIIQSGIINDKFANGNLLADIYWSGFEFLIILLPLAGFIFSLLYFNENLLNRSIGIFGSVALFVTFAIFIYINRIEGYSQNAAIEFYKSKQTEDCYIETSGFKSYAYLFYSMKPIQSNANHTDKNWLMTGETDKKVYIVTKNTKKEKLLEINPDLKILYEKNGFVFLER
jgi:4-amino-4-deoxy-L-arabinose transferase-like glycosyltransferase